MKSGRNVGRLPFVRTDRSVRTVRKWNVSVLRTARTGSGGGSGQTGPALGVGPASSLAPARNAGICALQAKELNIFKKWQRLLHGLGVGIHKLIILSGFLLSLLIDRNIFVSFALWSGS